MKMAVMDYGIHIEPSPRAQPKDEAIKLIKRVTIIILLITNQLTSLHDLPGMHVMKSHTKIVICGIA